MGNALKVPGQGGWIQDGPGADFKGGKVRLDERGVARLPEQEGGAEAASQKAFQDMAAHKPIGACEQDLQLDQAKFLADFASLSRAKSICLSVWVAIRLSRISSSPGGTAGGHDRVDENSFFLEPFAHFEGDHEVAHVQGQDGGL